MATDQQPQPPRAQLPVEERKWNHIVWSVSDTGVLAARLNCRNPLIIDTRAPATGPPAGGRGAETKGGR